MSIKRKRYHTLKAYRSFLGWLQSTFSLVLLLLKVIEKLLEFFK